MAGMVLDLQGPATVTAGGKTARLELLANVQPQSRIELPAGSKASITIYATRSMYRLSGPTVVDVARGAVTLIKGNPTETQAMGEKLVATAQSDKLIPGAYRMRSLVNEERKTNDHWLALKPSETAPIEDWVFYAAMLQQREAIAEAREAWKFITSRRADLEGAAATAK